VSAAQDQVGAERDLTSDEKRRLAVLGLPTFGLALSITLVSTYLPKVAQQFTHSTTLIGAVVGGEGIMAIWVPLVVGPWSDQLRTRIGGRLPFLLAAVPVMALALASMGFVDSFAMIALVAGIFFFAYFVAYEPYRAMYPDLIDDEVAGRAQGTQAAWRGAATGVTLLFGGLLLSASRPAPFALAAALAVAATLLFARFVVGRGLVEREERHPEESPRMAARRLRKLVADHPALRLYLVVNGLWEMALAALKAFVVLYLTQGLGVKLTVASLLVGGTGLIILGGAVAAGKLGDRLGRFLVIRRALWMYGLGLAVPIFVTFKPLVAAVVPLIALGGGAIMSLSYALLMPLMPGDERGALTGFYSVSRGIGITLGPVLAGILISLGQSGIFSGTRGYQAMWIVCAGAILASIPALRRLQAQQEDRRVLRES
jgi:MFS family permease